ncbi:hypothetical protein [Sinorhizobium fredii]|uniref:hypothetical protein n=1 Tax=Rhizobium fredii TaxID=380 RepID=UPI001F2461E2|nr:hypothetical protein [Sinorhizobium fredii]
MLRESSAVVKAPISLPVSSYFRYVLSIHLSNSYRRSLLSTSSVVASVIGPTPKNGFVGSEGAPPSVRFIASSR